MGKKKEDVELTPSQQALLSKTLAAAAAKSITPSKLAVLTRLTPQRQADILGGKPVSQITLTKSQQKIKAQFEALADQIAEAAAPTEVKLYEPPKRRDEWRNKITTKIKENEQLKKVKDQTKKQVKHCWEHLGELQDNICEWPGPARNKLEGALGPTIFETTFDDPMGCLLEPTDTRCKTDEPTIAKLKRIYENPTLNQLPILKEDKTNWRLYDSILGPTLDCSYNLGLDCLKQFNTKEEFGYYDVEPSLANPDLEPGKKKTYTYYYCCKKKPSETSEELSPKEMKKREKMAKKKEEEEKAAKKEKKSKKKGKEEKK